MLFKDRPELTEEQKTQKQIEAMSDSETLVRRLVADETHNKNIHETIERNIDHLSLMLSKENISKSGSPLLAGFQEAVNLGRNFVKG
jgi:hypothetical protein